jgi:hypothetical protein
MRVPDPVWIGLPQLSGGDWVVGQDQVRRLHEEPTHYSS